MSVPLIRFEHVTLAVRSQRLLSDVSFSLASGEKAVVRGRSGAGKSTLLKTLLGLHRPTAGRILYQGRPLDPATTRLLRTHAAYIGQEPVLGAETVREALLLPFRFKAHRGRTPTEAQLVATLAGLGLPAALLDHPAGRVSGGEKQRIALARALLLGKSLYLLDEITSALDAESKQAVLALLLDPTITVLSVAHDPEWIARCTKVYDLDQGRLARETQLGDG
ncbi:ABC transporter ATP-binding protein [Candidatus Methylocalor cossyra]|uniref:ABC transporter ATP-binding protein n=1 Tax=Candidatus Methylocalor cossyra TaxID=3108543 RepID=A0ABM9NFC4_9GAMM